MEERLKEKEKNDYINKLFPCGEPVIFKMLIEDAILYGKLEKDIEIASLQKEVQSYKETLEVMSDKGATAAIIASLQKLFKIVVDSNEDLTKRVAELEKEINKLPLTMSKYSDCDIGEIFDQSQINYLRKEVDIILGIRDELGILKGASKTNKVKRNPTTHYRTIRKVK